MNRNLHIVCFDVPFPPNYGGAIEVFGRIKALAKLGIRLHLHCFSYRERQPAPELAEFCHSIHYYDRPLDFRFQLGLLPFIVATRKPRSLLQRLVEEPFPVLFEGLHTCGFIDHPRLKNQIRAIRLHNIEWKYYRGLAALETHRLRKAYLQLESFRLRRFEKPAMKAADFIFPISTPDARYLAGAAYASKVFLLPAFHGMEEPSTQTGSGSFALFHGNLSIADNESSARFLIEAVFPSLNFPLVIAGLKPSGGLKRLCENRGILLVDSPESGEMARLQREAQLHLLMSRQADGAKIKLLNALHQGRHVVANSAVLDHSGLETLSHRADTAEEFQQIIKKLAFQPFTPEELEKRRLLLQEHYADLHHARRLVELIWPGWHSEKTESFET